MKFSSIFKQIQKYAHTITDDSGIGSVAEGMPPATLDCLPVDASHANVTLAMADGSVFFIDFDGMQAACNQLTQRLNATLGVFGVGPLWNMTRQLMEFITCNNTAVTQDVTTQLSVYRLGMPTNVTVHDGLQLVNEIDDFCRQTDATPDKEDNSVAGKVFTIVTCLLLIIAALCCLEQIRKRSRTHYRELFQFKHDASESLYQRYENEQPGHSHQFGLMTFENNEPEVTRSGMVPFEIEEPGSLRNNKG